MAIHFTLHGKKCYATRHQTYINSIIYHDISYITNYYNSLKYLEVVVEPRERLDENVGSFVAELITTGNEEIERLVQVKVKVPKTHRGRLIGSSTT